MMIIKNKYIHTCVLPFYIFSSDNVNFTITFPLSTSFVNIYIFFFSCDDITSCLVTSCYVLPVLHENNDRHKLCPNPPPIHYIVHYTGFQPFCSAVRILSERLHSLHSFTTFYPQCILIPSVQPMYTRWSTISHNPMRWTDELEERAGASQFEWEMQFTSFLFLL